MRFVIFVLVWLAAVSACAGTAAATTPPGSSPAAPPATGAPAAPSAPSALVRIATGEFPPYATASRPNQGIVLAVVRRAFELAGYRVEYRFLPWSRALAETREGQWDASAHWGATPERRRDFLLSDNVYTEQWHILYRRGLNFDWKTVDDLAPFRIGMTKDYTYTPALWAAAREGLLRAESTPNDLSALRMLLRERIDAVPLDRNVACETLMQNFDEADRAQVMLHPRLLTDSFTTHVLFPPGRRQSAVLLDAFNLGLRKLRSSPEYAKLTSGQVPCPGHWGVK